MARSGGAGRGGGEERSGVEGTVTYLEVCSLGFFFFWFVGAVTGVLRGLVVMVVVDLVVGWSIRSRKW